MAHNIDAGKQEQPHHVDEMPVPGGELEAEVMRRREVSLHGADQAHDEEDRADEHIAPWETVAMKNVAP